MRTGVFHRFAFFVASKPVIKFFEYHGGTGIGFNRSDANEVPVAGITEFITHMASAACGRAGERVFAGIAVKN